VRSPLGWGAALAAAGLMTVSTGGCAEAVSPSRALAAAGVPAPAAHAGPRGGGPKIADAVLRPGPAGRDDAERIQKLFDSLRPFQRLVIQPGNYVVGRSLRLAVDGVKISGYGATFVATNPEDQALFVSGKGAVLAGLSFRGVGRERLTTPESAKVVLTGQDIQVLDTTVDGGASGGIFVLGGHRIVIAGNVVRNTLADGIHTTGGASDVLITGNTVGDTGDDMIAVVSYRDNKVVSRNVLATGNTLLGNAWGRGMSVVGGADVTFENNTVRGVQAAAGILVAQEDQWDTFGVDNVIVRNNRISDIENVIYPNGELPAQHAAIDVNTGGGTVTRVRIEGNVISHASYGGVRMLGNVCRFEIDGTQLSDVQGTPINLSAAACMPSLAICAKNADNGRLLAPPRECTGSGPLGVTGADVSRLPSIDEAARSPQKAPGAGTLSSAR
jgi:hypothetical protein